MKNIFPVKILFKKTQKRNVLKWIEHVLALKADKYGGSIQKPVRQALRRILFKKKKVKVIYLGACIHLCTF